MGHGRDVGHNPGVGAGLEYGTLEVAGVRRGNLNGPNQLTGMVYQVTPGALRVRKEVNRHYEALMRAEGEPAGTGRA